MRMIHAELKIDNCPAELWLNDIPLKRLAPDQAHNISVPAHMYLLSGQNTLEILVNPGPTPSAARQSRSAANPAGSAMARVAAYEVGQFTGDPAAPVLLEASWDGASAGPGPYPRSAQARNDLGPLFGRWHWESADRLQLDAATIDAAAAVLESIRTSLAAGNPDVLLRFGERRFANAARAFPARPLDTIVAQFRRVVAKDAASPGWGFPALDRAQFDFRVVGEGRLLECINRDWRPTLRTSVLSDGYPKYYPMLLCRTGRQWEVGI